VSGIQPIRRLAIVNRGEAAMRCVRAVKTLRAREASSLECVALYTAVDADAPFVRYADHSVLLASPRGAVAAYLDREGMIEALHETGADAVWPGWGFVAEDPEFVRAVGAAGLRFLGPSADVMRSLGDKIASKHSAEAVGVPVIPWSGGAVADAEAALGWAEKIGVPLMIKATAGGGGRGIRLVRDLGGVRAAFESSSAEARSAFGDPTVFIEKQVHGGRHIEVQIAADLHGDTRSLGCRDCSVQRRHQKILEEAPPPGLSPALLEAIEGAAVRLVRSVGYAGVGTVEFLVAGDAFYFLEVNPRLQVEHGITEEITGVDLVELQIRIARGEPLPDFPAPPGGIAIEARVCAEDPSADFLPAPGHIAVCEPALGPNLRLDSGYAAGGHVPSEFDSLIAKVIARGPTREEARARLVCALTDFELVVEGGATNKGYLVDLLETDVYRAASFDTGWLDAHPELRVGTEAYVVEALVATSILYYQRARDAARRSFFEDPTNLTPAVIPPSTGQRVDLVYAGANYPLEVFAIGAWRYRVHLDGRVTTVRLRSRGPHAADLEIEGRSLRVLHDVSEHGARVEIESHPYRFESELAGQVRAGTPALVISLDVAVGDRVEAGQRLGLLEAMKLEIGFQAPVAGVVKEISVRGGQQVAAGDLLLVIDTGEAESEATDAARIELPRTPDELDVFFDGPGPDGEPQVSLPDADAAEPSVRRLAIAVARREIRRVVMGYDVNPQRVEKLAAVLEAPLPEGLSESFRWELAEIRHELALFADVEQLFSRVPRLSGSGEAEPSNYAELRRYVQRLSEGGEGASEDFRQLLETALVHYEATGLRYGDALERAVLRLLASQLAPELRRRLVLGCLKRVTALAGTGIHLGDDARLGDTLARIAGLRGLLPDRIADLAIEASYAIFQGPDIEREAERTHKDVEAWLAAAESRVSHPPSAVLAHLANAPLPVFQRVGRWLADTDPRRRAVAIAAHIRRYYATCTPASHTSGEVGGVPVERIDWIDGRIVVGSVAAADAIEATLERLLRAARAAAASAPQSRSAPRDGVHAIELLVQGAKPSELDALAETVAGLLPAELPVHRLNLNCIGAAGDARHLCFARGTNGAAERVETHGLHPETAHRIGLDRLAAFDLERIESAPDIYCFYLTGR